MFLHTWHPHSTLIALGGLTIHWYGLTLAAGAFAGTVVVVWLGKKYGVTQNIMLDLIFYFLIFGLIGARLYHVTNEWHYYAHHPVDIIKIWNGGLAIHGAIIAGLIVLWRFAKKHRLDAWRLADVLAPGLVLGQAIGRWGNYFNQELFGRPTNLRWGIPIDAAHRPLHLGPYFHPTFLYESIGDLIIFLLLLAMLRWSGLKKISDRPGNIALVYFVLYSFLRIGVESLRIDRVPIIAGIRLPLLTSLVIIGLVIITFLTRSRHTNAHA